MNPIILLMALHIVWCVLLYGMLTVARAPAIWGIWIKQDGSNPFDKIQPKISANLSNQFEWPLFFHSLCVILIVSEFETPAVMLTLGWVFIVGRVLHSLVQIFSASIKARGLVFTINYVAVLGMWCLFLVDHFSR